MRVPRKAAALAAAAAVACLAVSACGSVQMGAAAITGGSRISSANLTKIADAAGGVRIAPLVITRCRDPSVSTQP